MDSLLYSDHITCNHRGNCDNYIWKGVFSYFKLGVCLELAKRVYTALPLLKSNPSQIFGAMTKNKNIKHLKFLTIYIGLYRVSTWPHIKNENKQNLYYTILQFSHCLLNRYQGKETTLSKVMSGFLGGFAFFYNPSYPILFTGITSAIQVNLITKYQFYFTNSYKIFFKTDLVDKLSIQ